MSLTTKYLTWPRRTVPVTTVITALVITSFLLICARVDALGAQPVDAQQIASISATLDEELANANGPVSFLVILEDQVQAQEVIGQAVFAAQGGESLRTERGKLLYRALTDQALYAQAPVRAWLDEHDVPYRAFYIVNMIEVHGDMELAEGLRALPGVNRLAANPSVFGQEPQVVESGSSWLSMRPVTGLQSAATWVPGLYGLPFTHAPEVWDLGYTGQGIVVASQDTGVQWDHPALIESYRGYRPTTSGIVHAYNWFDAWSAPSPADLCGPDYQIPCDDNGHGTHTVGTMIGDATGDTSNGYGILGMAPDAQWIGCRNMRNNFGTPASYAACFEFMLAPYPQGGDPFTDGHPSLAPHIINNSWSCPPTEGCDAVSLRQVVETSRAAGQLVVASAGNYGPSCSSVRYPIALHDAAFTVGAHDQNGIIASFSSRGPVSADGSNRLKPDISAPGVSVLSAIPYNSYSQKSGTSMSSPHVAGAAALVWSAAPDLIGNIELTEQVLIKSAAPVVDDQCLAGLSASPNPAYGYGWLDAMTAVTLARTPWAVEITTEDESENPLPNVRVELTDALTYFEYAAISDADGVATLAPVLSGDYVLGTVSGDTLSNLAQVTLPPTDDPDIGMRQRSLTVTVPVPTALEEDDAPPRPRIYLPQIGR